MPKRALSEQRQGGLFDISRSYGVGRFDPSMITNSLTGSIKTTPNRGVFSLSSKYFSIGV